VSARVIIQAPSHLGLRAAGVEALPEALLAAGLAERLGARRGTRLPVPAFDPSVDAGTGLLNPRGLRDYAARLADAVGAVLDEGAFPIVLGGDCTILLGITLALRRRGRSGLLFLDGHADFYQPEADPTGEAASMELALVTGRGPDLVTDLEGRRPLLRDEDVVVFGFRDAERAAAEGSRPLAPTIRAMDLPSVRERGAGRAARDALAHLERRDGPAGFWVHLDVDVLDDAVMPAVDYRLPDGLTWEELIAVLRSAVASDHATGLRMYAYYRQAKSGPVKTLRCHRRLGGCGRLARGAERLRHSWTPPCSRSCGIQRSSGSLPDAPPCPTNVETYSNKFGQSRRSSKRILWPTRRRSRASGGAARPSLSWSLSA
jgi:arginase